jgi:hypothetical protein
MEQIHWCTMRSAAIAVGAVCAFLVATPAKAQEALTRGLHVTAGSDTENYLRTLQLLGVVPEYPWSLRAFSRREADSLARFAGAHPWSSHAEFRTGRRLSLAPLEVSAVTNSAFPWGFADGPVWAGRGPTVSVSAGVVGGSGPFSFAINPIAFYAANTAFEMAPNGQSGALAFADTDFPTSVDRPQRFGDSPYSQVDPGNSYVRFDALGVAAGISTANEFWGPASAFPFILGNNAPGFLHGFLGTSVPTNIGIGRAHVRLQWARLEQSEYSPVTGSRTYVSVDEPGHSRFAPGMVLVLQPRGVRGLELGVTRFTHLHIPAEGIPGGYWTRMIESPFRQSLTRERADSLGVPVEASDQLASVFFRWLFAGNGLEIYGEYGKEDYNADFRDLVQEPDHQRSYMVGAAKAFQSQRGHVHALRAELINFQLPALARTRDQGLVYVHALIRQGHTHRGQMLGAPVGLDAAAGSVASWRVYTPRGAYSAHWTRILRRERGDFHQTGLTYSRSINVAHELGGSALWFTRIGDVTVGLAGVHEFNRHYARDAWNFQLHAGLRKVF